MLKIPMKSGLSKRVLAISSGGGHWVQLLRLRPAFEGFDVVYASVNRGSEQEVDGAPFHLISDATRWDRWRLAISALGILWLLIRVRPDVVVSTGAAPGYFALRFGRLLGARTIWVDSIANVDELSMAGRWAGKCADLWLTQWPHLAREEGPRCEGAVL